MCGCLSPLHQAAPVPLLPSSGASLLHQDPSSTCLQFTPVQIHSGCCFFSLVYRKNTVELIEIIVGLTVTYYQEMVNFKEIQLPHEDFLKSDYLVNAAANQWHESIMYGIHTHLSDCVAVIPTAERRHRAQHTEGLFPFHFTWVTESKLMFLQIMHQRERTMLQVMQLSIWLGINQVAMFPQLSV